MEVLIRTIPRRLGRNRVRGDYRAMCDYCSVMWMRSKLRRDAAGYLRCPDETGKDEVTLNRENAAGALAAKRPVPPRDGGNYDRYDEDA